MNMGTYVLQSAHRDALRAPCLLPHFSETMVSAALPGRVGENACGLFSPDALYCTRLQDAWVAGDHIFPSVGDTGATKWLPACA
jgi:hypothetical protein